LSDDYKKAFNMGIRSKCDNEAVAAVAQDRLHCRYSGSQSLRKLLMFFVSLGGRKLRSEGMRKKPYLESKHLVPSGLFVEMWGHV
jgi:hypothetical protein